MGGSFFIVYIGRDLTAEEEEAFRAKHENAEVHLFDYKESVYTIDGFNVAYDDVFEEYVICQYYIGTVDTEDINQTLHDGVNLPNPYDDRYKLRVRYSGK